MTKLEEFRSGEGPIPEQMLRWHFYGDGLESLKLERVPVPSYGPDELLVRQDANGICFSDIKVISLGKDHPRMVGRDLQADPVTLGHEVSCTIVGVGENRRSEFQVGQRFIVQADVFHGGVSMAYGYAIRGGLAEYSVIPTEMIDGDEGCYLMPIRPQDGYVEAALIEPWACVVSAYSQSYRSRVMAAGDLLVIEGRGATDAICEGMIRPDGKPRHVTLVGAGAHAGEAAEVMGGHGGVTHLRSVEDWQALKQQQTGGSGFDDIVVLGGVSPEVIENAASTLADRGILNLVGDYPIGRKLSIDIGRIHYNWHHYIGTSSNRAVEAYPETNGRTSSELKAGGLAWFIGAGGPMGQMHVQRAVQLADPPRRIVATDIDGERLQSVTDRFGGAARARGVELITLNPKLMTPDAFDEELRRLSETRGFDDIVSLVPVPALIEHAAGFLADGAWFNIFAGVARGTMARLDLNDVVQRGVRYIGSSGSSLADMRQALEKMEAGELSTNMSLAAIGGMRFAREGIAAVKAGRFPGKTLIFPLVHDLPLTALDELRASYPTVYAKLQNGQFWTRDAEEELLRLTIGKAE